MRCIEPLAGCALAFALCGPALAEVKRSASNGFVIERRVTVPAPPERAFAALGQVQNWWDPAHTYSGKSSNLTMGLNAGDCFCERIPSDGGSVEHGRVVYSRPASTLRLSAALGPLQSEAVNGTLTWTLKTVASGTEVTQTYVVGGYFRDGAEPLAPVVDQVMSTQLRRFEDYLSRRR
jgi:uncharacterized protein YndB with AHSA1/START domain